MSSGPSKVDELRRQAAALFEGDEIDFAYESVRLFLLCEGTRWAHLPVSGGWYAQHPLLLDEWEVILQEKAAHRRREKQRERFKNKGMDNGFPAVP